MPRRPQVGVHDDPAEGFAIFGGLAVVAFATAIFSQQGSTYGCPGFCLRTFELGLVGEAFFALLGIVGGSLSASVYWRGWSATAARTALGLAVLSALVFGWWWFSYGGALPTILGLAAVAMLGFAGGRGVFVGTDPGTTPQRD